MPKLQSVERWSCDDWTVHSKSLKNYTGYIFLLNWTWYLVIENFGTFLSKSWKRSVKPSGLSWMEDMTISSVLWLHAWGWRKQMWKMPYWRGIRYFAHKCSNRLYCFIGQLYRPWKTETSKQKNVVHLQWDWTVLRFCFHLCQIDRMEQFFMADGLPHLMFYYQDTEPTVAGTMKL